MYAIVAPGFSNIYTNWRDVERVKALYPYPKWCKCKSEEEAYEFIRRNKYGFELSSIYNYGNTFDNLYLTAFYKIGDNCVYYIVDCSKVGKMRVSNANAIIEYRSDKIYIKLPDIRVSDTSISGHMSAIYHLLVLLGDFVDINLVLPNYSIFYALSSYKGTKCRSVQIVQSLIKKRLAAISYTLEIQNGGDNSG